MRFFEILFEDIWSDIATKWSDKENIPLDQVESYINKYKQLKQKNMFDKPEHKDIQHIYKNMDFLEFKQLVDQTEIKANQTKGAIRSKIKNSKNQIIFKDTSDIQIVVPKDMNASINLGSGTNWCTATNTIENNYFDRYTYRESKTTLIYIILKHTGEKFAIRFDDENGEIIEIRNKNNNALDDNEFEYYTSLNSNALVKEIRSNQYWKQYTETKSRQEFLYNIVANACYYNNLKMLESAINQGADLGYNNFNCLKIALLNNRLDIIKYIIEKVPAAKDILFVKACKLVSKKGVELAINSNCKIDYVNGIAQALENRNTDFINFLIGTVPTNFLSNSDIKALMKETVINTDSSECSKGNSYIVLKFLIGISSDIERKECVTLLMRSVNDSLCEKILNLEEFNNLSFDSYALLDATTKLLPKTLKKIISLGIDDQYKDIALNWIDVFLNDNRGVLEQDEMVRIIKTKMALIKLGAKSFFGEELEDVIETENTLTEFVKQIEHIYSSNVAKKYIKINGNIALHIYNEYSNLIERNTRAITKNFPEIAKEIDDRKLTNAKEIVNLTFSIFFNSKDSTEFLASRLNCKRSDTVLDLLGCLGINVSV